VKAKVGQMCREGLLGSEWAPGLVSRRFTPVDAIPISITFDKKTPRSGNSHSTRPYGDHAGRRQLIESVSGQSW
jgi:hypothetical protein